MIGTLRGRDTELAVLAGSLAAAAAGEGSLLVLEGPAGIGKTTLLDAAAARGRDCGMAVLRARGNPLEQDFSFGIARQAFAPLQSTEAWTELCHGPAGLAERVLSAGAPAPASGPDALYAAAHGLFQLTANQAARWPTVLCVDDVHWADIPSLRWLVGLVRRVDELPLTLVVALRSGEPVADQRTMGELLGGAAGVSLRLRPLDADAAATIVHAALPGAGPALTRACHAATGGNPFLLTTLLAHLKAERVEPDEGATAAVEGIGPYVVARWVEQQLRRLPDGTADLARALAVLGRAATLRHAASLAGLELERAAVLTDALRAAGLAAPGAELALAHPIVSAALYDGLGPGERSVWHARAARLLAADHDEPERAAVHLLRAEPVGDGAGVDLLREAADRATARGAPETAATFLRRALAEPPRDRDTDAAVRLDLALALAAGRQAGTAELARDVVARIDDPTTRADAVLRAARALGLAGQNDVAVELCRLVSEHPAGVSAATLARIAAELAANAWTDSRTKLLAQGLTRWAGADPPLWRVAASMEMTFAGHPAAECLAVLAPLLDGGVLDHETDSLLPTVATITLLINEDLDRARAASEAVVAAGHERGWISAVAHGRFLRSLALLPAGAVRAAEADARAAYEFKVATATPMSATLWALHPMVEALIEGDRPDEAEAALRAAGLGDPPPHALTAPLILQSRARLRLAQGRAADALTDLRDAAARWDELEVRHPGMAAWRADAVGALLSLGERAAAERVAGEHLAAAERAGVSGPLCAGLRASALVAPRERRIALLERAVRVSGGLQHGYALYDLGCALRRANRRADARGPLRAALDLADAGGAARLARLALAELHAAGARPRRTALRGLDALTTAERQIAGLAAQGFTNRQIAERLALSRRTVETHLAHAYQKLDIRSRADLASLLHAS
jgi:DNA-binding CsgD family transcriptional regulator